MRIYRHFILLILIYTCTHTLHAQVVHAGVWTGYEDGVTVSGVLIRDSIMYVQTRIGTARVNPTTHAYSYLRDLGEPDLPKYIDFDLSAIDQLGRLWTMNDDRLLRIDSDLSVHVVGSKPKDHMTVLRCDHGGKIWAGFYTETGLPGTKEALATFNGTSWDFIDVGVEGLNVRDIAFDTDNHPWFTSSPTIYKFNGSAFEVVKNNGSPVYGGERLAISHDGRIAGAGDFSTSALRYFNKSEWKVISNTFYSYPIFDDDNILWLIDSDGNAYRMDENDNVPQKVLTSAVNYRTGELDNITGFGLDGNGQVWIGRYNGLFVAPDYTTDQWDFVPLTTLPVPGPHPAVAASGDTTWLASAAGVTRLINDQFEKLNIQQTNINAVFYDEFRQGLWLCSPGTAGFYKGDSQTLFNINSLLMDSTFYNNIYDIKNDTTGNIWFRVREGLLRYNPSGEWKTFFVGKELPLSPNGVGYFAINAKDNSIWVRTHSYSMPGITIPPKLLKIEGDQVTDTHFDVDVLYEYGPFAVISDSILWFSGYPDVLLYDHGVKTEYIPGLLNNEHFIVYNDSTILLCSNFGLYVFVHGQWFKPEIPSDRIANDDAYPSFLTSEGKLVMANYPLLVIDDIEDLLSTLTTAIPPLDTTLIMHYYPNPVHDVLYLDPEKIQLCPDCVAEIFSINGSIIRNIPSPLSPEIDLSQIPAGLYLLQIHSGTKSFPALKVIKY